MMNNTEKLVGLMDQTEKRVDSSLAKEYFEYIENAISHMAQYVQRVVEHQVGTTSLRAMRAAGLVSPENYRFRFEDLDLNRKLSHDAAMAEMSLINRICGQVGIEPICPDPETTPRDVCGNYCAAVTAEFYLKGTGKDDETVRKAAELLGSDPFAMDKIVALIEKGLAKIDLGERR